MTTDLPSPEILRKLLRYEPETGKLFWRKRTPDMFKTEKACRCWNTRHAGNETFSSVDKDGYLLGMIFYRRLKSHRVIYAMAHGRWPKGQIDHIDGVKTNNKIENLRDVSPSQNARNMPLRTDNKTGISGITFHKRSKKWQCQLRDGGTDKYIGSFDTLGGAIAAMSSARAEHGYHENHGRALHSMEPDA